MSTRLVTAKSDEHGIKGRSLAERLSASIRAGRFAPGQRLVEADLTAELGVGRGLLREAFRKLSAEGLIELVPNRGALVRRFSLCEALELFEIRNELECLAARRAANHIADLCTRESFERAAKPIWSDHVRQGSDDYLAENQRFHAAIMAASGNAQLVSVSERLQLSLILSQIRFALTPDVLAHSVAEHRRIAQAILDGDPVAAGLAMREHLDRATEIVKSVPADAFRPAPLDLAVPATR